MIAVVGMSHKTAPVEVRERLAFSAEDLNELLPALHDRFGPVVVLSTCNRTEIYLEAAHPDSATRDLIAHIMSGRPAALQPEAGHLYALYGTDAVRHLYRVSAGLESMVLGESQILGQVRDAIHTARHAGVVDSLLDRLFRSAISAGRRVRSGWLAGSSASVSSAAVRAARNSLGDLGDKAVLIVSAGEAAKLTAQSLARMGAGRIVIAGRTPARASKLAEGIGARAIPMHCLPQALAEADVVVSAAGSREFQIGREAVARAVANREARPLILIDLAVPRDIDPESSTLPDVVLYDIDALQAFIEEEERPSSVELVEHGIEEEVARFMEWWQSRSTVPTIAALRHKAESIRQAELAKTLNRLPELSSEERRRIDALTGAIVKKLLHRPIVYLKDSDNHPDRLAAVQELFDLKPASE